MSEFGAAEGKVAIDLIRLAIRQGWFDKIKDALRKKHKVLVLGSTGVGKANFIESLTEVVPKAIDGMNRTEFVKTNSMKLSKQPFVFVDTPGQELHSSRRMQAIREAIGSGIAGVINVVAYGYHEGRTGKRDAVARDGSAKEAFLRRNRRLEISALDDWTPLLGSRETPSG